MGKVIKTKDAIYRVSFEYPHYFLEKRIGRWYNHSWEACYKTINKTLFIKTLNKHLV